MMTLREFPHVEPGGGASRREFPAVVPAVIYSRGLLHADLTRAGVQCDGSADDRCVRHGLLRIFFGPPVILGA